MNKNYIFIFQHKFAIALGLNLALQFCRWRSILIFPGRYKKNRVLSCLLFCEPGKTDTDRHLAGHFITIKGPENAE